MSKDFLYCEETHTAIRKNDIVTLSSDTSVRWVVKRGWFQYNGSQSNGWYLRSIIDNTIIPIDDTNLSDIQNDDDATYVPEITQQPTSVDSLCDGDITNIEGYSGQWVVKYGWYTLNNAQAHGWYLQSLSDSTVIALADMGETTAPIIVESLDDVDSGLIQSLPHTPIYDHITVPGTNICLYDNDIVTLGDDHRRKYIIHCGWYIYNGVQNYGWYLCSISNGATIPVSSIDLTTIVLDSSYTQGSTNKDGKKVDYTRPFTEHDSIILNRAFITVDTIEQRDNLSGAELPNGRMVRVNDVEGTYAYFSWNATTQKWDSITFETTIPVVTGTPTDNVVLSKLNQGLYVVKGQYRVSTTDEIQHISMGDTLVSVSTGAGNIYIKDISSSWISDYVVDSNDYITIATEYTTKEYLMDNYATIAYVDSQIQALELSIQEWVLQTVEGIVDRRLEESIHGISSDYINNLFNANEEEE